MSCVTFISTIENPKSVFTMMADFQFGDELQLCLSIHYMKYYRFSQVYDSFYLLRQVKSLTPDSILFHSIMNNTYTHIYIDTHLSSFIFLLDLSQWLIFKYTHTHIYIYIYLANLLLTPILLLAPCRPMTMPTKHIGTSSKPLTE